MNSIRSLRSLKICSQLNQSPIKHQTRSIKAFGYEQVKALTFSDYGEPQNVLGIHQHSISPTATSNDSVIIRFLAAPINPADVNQIQGTYPSKPKFVTDLGSPSPLAVAGNEGVAEVTAAGPKSPLRVGDWVIPAKTNFGTWRTHALASAQQLMKIERDGLQAQQVATVTVNPCTAFRMLKDFVRLESGDFFIQNVANSAVGRAAIQLGKLWGFRSINVVRHREEAELNALKQELVGLGADVVITDEQLAAKDAKDLIASITGDSKPKLGFNALGGQPTLDLAKQLAKGGHIVTYGAMNKKPITVPASLFIFKDITYHGFWLSAWSDAHQSQKKETVDSILDLYRQGSFQIPPMEEINWDWDTKSETLTTGISKMWDASRKKGIFVFGKT